MDDVLTLIEDEIPHLRRYARYLARDANLADDLVQDALVRAIASRDSWRQGTNMRAWLFVILRNTFINDCRRARRSPLTADAESAGGMLSVPGNQESACLLGELAEAFDSLPKDHQEVLVVVVMEGMTYEDAASVLKVPVGTIRSRLARARLALRKAVDGYDYTWETPARAGLRTPQQGPGTDEGNRRELS
ncbi:MAG TPA: sigma-70 family RNA polymerase sigma factor [Alphaproteobacteria bacterium]|nr:sigma-70 family RNA polymerase sigma factor [Alphaproteobacteria bacterium]